MKDIRNWWAETSARDRRILLLGAAITLLLLGWALVWQPLEAARKAARTAHAEMAAQHAEVRALAEQLASRAKTGGAAAGVQSPLAAVEAVARDQRLLEPLKRREAEGTNRVHLVLENAPADALMRLLERLDQQYGLRIVQAQIDPVTTGRVNASITLQRGGTG
ncbi:MAG: type II secretion system protein M [Gammaproteobacteria bacterium]|nr:type II secretion system protein M [Gammaproteobacteria bacterium]